jgi:hypothetical protein
MRHFLFGYGSLISRRKQARVRENRRDYASFGA